MSLSDLLDVRVHALRHEANEVLSVELVPLTGRQLPGFTPGAHVDVHLANGLARSYSLLNDCDERHRYMLGILCAPDSRGASRFVHEQLRVGTVLQISMPRNHFQLDESATHTVLIAGGIGITPILCMARRLRALGRSAHLMYCARSRGHAAFLDELTALEGGTLRTEFYFDDERGGVPLDLIELLADQPAGTHAYCCGPAPMLQAFERACMANQIADVHLERFSADTNIEPITDGGRYTVELARSGKVLDVAMDQTLLATLLEAGIVVNHSCTEGICGSCEVNVICGQPIHRDSILSAREKAAGKTMMVCVSGAKAGEKLVLDL